MDRLRLDGRTLTIDFQPCPNCGSGEIKITATILWVNRAIEAERAPGETSGATRIGASNGPGASSKPAGPGSAAHAGLTRVDKRPFEIPMREPSRVNLEGV